MIELIIWMMLWSIPYFYNYFSLTYILSDGYSYIITFFHKQWIRFNVSQI